MTEIIIAEWRRNAHELLRVRLDSYMGNTVVCVRSWYPGSDGTMKPGRSGFTVSTKHLPALAEAIAKALETAKADGLIQEQEGGGT